MNRFEELNYINAKIIETLISKIIAIKLKWKNLKIIENKFFVLKLFNVLNSSFEIYLIILNEEIKRNENLLNLNTLITCLKQKEHRIKTQKKQINVLHYHQNNNNSNFEKRNSRENYENRDWNKKNKNADNERDNNEINDNIDEKNNWCINCYIIHKLSIIKYCFDKNFICFNEKCKNKDYR